MWLSLVEHLIWDQRVVSPNLTIPTRHGAVAQLGEHQFSILEVAGSSPVSSTIIEKENSKPLQFSLLSGVGSNRVKLNISRVLLVVGLLAWNQ